MSRAGIGALRISLSLNPAANLHQSLRPPEILSIQHFFETSLFDENRSERPHGCVELTLKKEDFNADAKVILDVANGCVIGSWNVAGPGDDRNDFRYGGG